MQINELPTQVLFNHLKWYKRNTAKHIDALCELRRRGIAINYKENK